MSEERRIEVHTRYGEPITPSLLDEDDILDAVELSGLCNKCENDVEVALADDFLNTAEDEPGLSWDGIFRQAEIQGLDLTRSFRMEMHLAQEYVEFWQTPTELPR